MKKAQEKTQPAEGIKHDGEKPPLSLIPQYSLLEVGKVMAYGAKKYDAHNWRKGIVYSRLISAAMRHLGAYTEGESIDPETSLSHVAHAATNLLFLLEMIRTRPDLDDRFKNENPDLEYELKLSEPDVDLSELDLKEDVKCRHERDAYAYYTTLSGKVFFCKKCGVIFK